MQTCKIKKVNFVNQAGLTPLVVLVVLTVASSIVVGGGSLLSSLSSKGYLNVNLGSLKSLVYSQPGYLDSKKVADSTFDSNIVGTVALPDGSYSAYHLLDGSVKDNGESFGGEVKIEFLSGDRGLGTYSDGTIVPFYLADGTKTVGVVMNRMVVNLVYNNGSGQSNPYAIKVLQGSVNRGRLVGNFVGQTYETGYIIAGKADESGYISEASVTTGAARATEAETAIANNALTLFKKIALVESPKVLAANTTGYQIPGLNQPIFDSKTGRWSLTSSSNNSTAASQSVANYLQQLSQTGNQNSGSFPITTSLPSLPTTVYQYLPVYLQSSTPATTIISGIKEVKSATTGLKVSTSDGVATLSVDFPTSTTTTTTTVDVPDNAVTSAKISDHSVGVQDLSQSLSFSSSQLLDLSAVSYATSGQQGFRLPMTGATPINPSGGKGYLAYDAINNQVIQYNGTSWQAVDGGGGGSGSGISIVQEGDTNVVPSANTLDFWSNDFAVSQGPTGEANVAIDYSNSNIARSNQTQSISGTWTFTNGLVLGTDTITDISGSGLSVASGVLKVSGLTTTNFASPNISQFTNNLGYLTDVGWGAITGTLSNQTDLQTVLDAKANSASLGTLSTQNASSVSITGGSLSGLTSVGATTFTGDLTGNITGNAGTVTNGLYSTGSYTDPSWLTSLSPAKVLPNQTGNSGKVLGTNGSTISWVTNSSGVAWGAITGTLSDQTDLQSALGLKVDSSSLGTAAFTAANDYATATQGTLAVNALPSASFTDAAVSGKFLTGFVSGAGTVAATDTILQAIQKLNGNDATNANLTGVVTSVGNVTSIANGVITDTMLANGAVANLSGTNTGDDAVNSNYASDYRAANFVAGTNYLTPTGSAASLTSFPTLNQSTTGTASNITGVLGAASFPAMTGDVTNTQGSLSVIVASGAITLSKMSDLAANSIIGNNTGSSATPIALTTSQVKSLLSIANTDVSGLGTLSTQNANSVLITGGSLSGLTSVGATTFTGALTGNASTVTGFSPTSGKTLSVSKTMTFTSADDTGVYTLPTGTATLMATNGSAANLTSFPTFNQNTTGTAAGLSVILSSTSGGSGINNAGTLTWGAGGTLGTAAYTTASDYATAAQGTLATNALPSTSFTNAAVSGKLITGYVSGAGIVTATDSILQAIQKLNGNDATNANLTGVVTSVGNTTSIANEAITNAMLANSAVANLSGTNTGDNAANSNYASDYRAANFVAGTNYLTPTGSAASLNSFPTFNQNTTGTAAGLSAVLVSTSGGSGINNAGTLTWGAGGTLGTAAYTATSAYATAAQGTLATNALPSASFTDAAVSGKLITGYVSGAGTVAATDSILQAIQKLNGNDATNANLTGVVTSVGNATSIANGAITNVMLANGAVANLSGTNTGDNAANSNYASDYRAANFVAGTNYLTPTGSAAGLTSFPTLNQSTTGNALTATTATTGNALANTDAAGQSAITAINSATTGTINTARLNSTVTTQGNTFNGISQLVRLDTSGNLPVLNASALTGITGDQVLPTQTGNNGKVLGTNGTTVSWVVNSASVVWGGITGTLANQTDLNTALSGKLTTTLPSANIFVGNGSSVATGVAMSGDVTIDNTGLTTIGSGKVSLAKMSNLAANSIIGNNTGSSATPIALTTAQVKTLLAIANTDVSGLGTMSTQNSSGVSITGGTATGLTGLAIRSSGTGAFDLTIANTENLTAGRTLTITTGNAARSLTLTGDASISGTNTGDNAANSNYASDYRAANFVAGTNYLTPTGSAASLTSFPTFNQNTTGTAAGLSAVLVSTSGGSGINNAGTLTWGSGGTLGTAAYTAASAYATAAQGTLATNALPSASFTDAAVSGKLITGYVSGAGTVAATDSLLQAIQKLNGNDATNANLTGVVTSVGNATSIANGAITNAMLANGAVANLSGTNTGDNAANSTYASDYRAANFVAGTNYLTPTGSAASLTSFPTFNQNTTGTAANITGVLGASSFPAMTGDVTNTQGSLANAIASGAVTLTKMANMATASFIGRNTAGLGVPEVLSATTAKTILAIATGDVSGLGTIATQASNNVTLTGGTINGITIGGSTAAAGTFTTVTANTSITRGTDTITDFTGNGLTLSTGTLTITAPTAADALSSTTSNGSGIEVLSSGITLLQGCADGQILKWTESSDTWSCQNDNSSAGGGIATIQVGDVDAVTSATTIDLLAADFDVTNSPTGEGNVSIDYTNSGITRKGQAETVTGGWTFNTAATTFTTAITANGGITLGANNIDGTSFDVTGASGNIVTAGTLAVNGDSITADGATLVINAAGTVNVQDALDIDSTIQAGSSNITLTLATGMIDADALTLTAAVDGGTGTSSGSGLAARSDGIGLLQGCTDGQILKWVESTDTWDCAADATGGGGGWTTVVKAANEVVTNSTALQADNHLLFTMSASTAYAVRIILQYQTSNTTHDFKYDVSYPSGATGVLNAQVGTTNTAATALTQCTMAVSSTSTNDCGVNTSTASVRIPGRVEGYIVNGVTGGNFTFNWSGNAASSGNTTTVFKNSYLEYIALGAADLAEVYYSDDQSIEPGDVVALDPAYEAGVKKTQGAYDQKTVGIVSTKPGLLLGDAPPSVDPDELATRKMINVGLSGRVPVKVITENGPIKAGDLLTPSSTPGVAMKATKAGIIVGQALTSYEGNVDNPEEIGNVVAFIKTSYSVGVGTAGLTANLTAGNATLDIGKSTLDAFLRQNSNPIPELSMSEVVADRVAAGVEVITPRVVADKVETNGLTVSGILTADVIKARRIEGLEIYTNQIASLSNLYEKLSEEVAGIATESGIPQISEGDKSIDLKVLGNLEAQRSLVVGGISDFGGNSMFKSLVEFLSNVIFRGEVNFAGRVFFNKDSAGFAVVPTGTNEVEVRFEKEYAEEPVITASPNNPVLYSITDSTTRGFKIKLATPANTDIRFSWNAIAVKDPLIIKGILPSQIATPTPTINPAPTNTPEATPTATETPVPIETPTPALTPSPVSTPNSEPESLTVLSNELGYVRIRENPTTDSNELGQIPTGETLNYQEENGNWYKVEYQGMQGWVSGMYVEIN